MPIVVGRKGGKIISAPEIAQEQRDKLWETVVRAYIQRHPEMLQADSQAVGKDNTGKRGIK